MALYLTRYLNVPPARIPGEGGEQLDDLPPIAGRHILIAVARYLAALGDRSRVQCDSRAKLNSTSIVPPLTMLLVNRALRSLSRRFVHSNDFGRMLEYGRPTISRRNGSPLG